MRSLLLTFSLSTAILVSAQGPIERYYPLEGAVGSQGGIMDQQGGLIHVATVEGDIVVMRTLPEGEVDWMRRYPFFTEEGLYGPGLVTTSAGIFVAGYTMGMGTQSRDGLLLHLDTEGNLLSTKRIDVAGGSNAFHSVTPLADGFLIAGRSQPSTTSYDMLISAFDADGEMLWSRSYGSDLWDWAYEAIPLADGGFALVGYGDGLAAQTRAYVVRTDADGQELWARSIGSGPADEGYTVAEDEAGNLYVGGRTLGMGVPSPHVSGYVTKLDPSGDHLWTRVLPNSIEMVDLQVTATGGVTWIARPQYIEGAPGNYDIAWGVLDADGNAVYTKIYGREGNDNVMTLVPKNGGGWYLLGSTNSHAEGYSFFTLEIDAVGEASCIGRDWDNAWLPFTPNVLPFVSVYNEGATVNDLVFGTSDVSSLTIDPCCALTADFTATQSGTDPYTWTFTNTSVGVGAFSWDLGDGTTSTAVSVTHTYTGNGNFSVCLTMTGECGEAETCVPVSITVGIAERSSAVLQAYPVPADTELRVVVDGEVTSQVRAIDIHGRRITASFTSLSGSVILLDVSSLAAGSYTMELQFASGRRAYVPVVVAH
jgi:PKD repeat protein